MFSQIAVPLYSVCEKLNRDYVETIALGCSLSSLVMPGIMYDQIDLLGKSKIKTFELNPSIFICDWDHKVRDEFRNMLLSTGKNARSYHMPMSTIDDFSSYDEAAREKAFSRFYANLAEAEFFGVKFIVLHPSLGMHERDDRSRKIKQLRCSMKKMENVLKKKKLKLALENLQNNCLGNSLEELLQILEGFDTATFGVCLDINHLNENFKKIPDIVRTLNSQLFTIHLSDYNGISECHWIPGKGVIDWQELINTLNEVKYRGPFNYEISYDATLCLLERIKVVERNFAWLTGNKIR
jgi:sugar phosphate isomerase/epimerase